MFLARERKSYLQVAAVVSVDGGSRMQNSIKSSQNLEYDFYPLLSIWFFQRWPQKPRVRNEKPSFGDGEIGWTLACSTFSAHTSMHAQLDTWCHFFFCYSVLAIFGYDICKASLVKYISTDPNGAILHVYKCNYFSTIAVKLLATERQYDVKFNSKRQSNWFYTIVTRDSFSDTVYRAVPSFYRGHLIFDRHACLQSFYSTAGI